MIKIKKILKKILKIFISDTLIKKYKYIFNQYKTYDKKNIFDGIGFIVSKMRSIKVFKQTSFSKIANYSKEIKYNDSFVYMVDFNCFCSFSNNLNVNMTPDYASILDNSLNDFKQIFSDNKEICSFIIELEKYLDTYINRIKNIEFKEKDITIKYLENIKDKKCECFVEALQRILFFNQIFWQLGYKLCGLGRLDYILDNYYKDNNDKLDVEKIIIDFYDILNKHFIEKSGCLSGDTGQIIIIGGIDENGKNFCNDLTFCFINALKKYNRPDPKLFLRVNKYTNRKLIENAIDCMSTGIGSPMLSNDDIIIPKLIEYGYDKKDAWNYVTAACWEPSPCGDSIDLNNIYTLNLLKPFNDLFDGDISNITKDNILEKYYENLTIYIKKEISNISNIKFDSQPYLSLFIKSCRETSKSIKEAKIKYCNLGLTTLGIANVVNSIINIEEIVFCKNFLTLEELNENRKNNFSDEKLLKIIKTNNKKGYCSNDKKAIDLTNNIIEFISNELEKYTNYYGGKFKFGLSAPSYVENGFNLNASFDGRKDGEPLNVHISSNYTNYLEIMSFASKIKYPKNAINGNVVDFVLTPNYINNNIDKFTDYVLSYIKNGIYQMQINVIDSETLINAKNNPELYKNLIVRVWGFSAYFNDLPEEYKDLLINRALASEGVQK